MGITTQTFDQSTRRRARSLLRAAHWLAWITIVLGLFVLIVGWGFSSFAVITLRPGLAGMAPSTALLFVLSGYGALLSQRAPARRGRWGSRSAIGLALFGGLVALVNLVIAATGSAQGIDELLLGRLSGNDRIAMSTGTAMNFLALSAGIILLQAPLNVWRRRLAIACVMITLLTSLIAITGYAFNVASLYRVSLFAAMALHTSVVFIALSLALLFQRPAWGPVGLVIGGGEGSRALRRLLPAVLLCPFALAWLVHAATRLEMFDLEFGLSLIPVVCMVALTAILFRTAVVQNRSDRQLRRIMRDLQAALAHRELLASELNHRVRNNLQQISAMIHMESDETQDETVRGSLHTTAGRIRALAAVHDRLLSTAEANILRLDVFLRELCDDLARTLGAEQRGITLTVEAEAARAHFELALKLGLLVNEIITNAFRHAFVDGRAGDLSVRYRRRDDGGATLDIRDNGVGLPESAARFMAQPGVGTRIIEGIVHELNADLSIDGRNGFHVSLGIPQRVLQAAGATE